ncbi:hypothetical protein ATE80_22555 [Streptomyces kanasensis]|uniref:Uncharacterized protein n=1 Tax=Streptomyces kanasensis TaxID=936756 RepID=A0A100Y2U9_9ACTN|nr:hypothetical protein ATE80_22555 [Streptomyces kanasensis]
MSGLGGRQSWSVLRRGSGSPPAIVSAYSAGSMVPLRSGAMPGLPPGCPPTGGAVTARDAGDAVGVRALPVDAAGRADTRAALRVRVTERLRRRPLLLGLPGRLRRLGLVAGAVVHGVYGVHAVHGVVLVVVRRARRVPGPAARCRPDPVLGGPRGCLVDQVASGSAGAARPT